MSCSNSWRRLFDSLPLGGVSDDSQDKEGPAFGSLGGLPASIEALAGQLLADMPSVDQLSLDDHADTNWDID